MSVVVLPEPLGPSSVRNSPGATASEMQMQVADNRIIASVGSMMPAAYGNSFQIIQSPGFVAIRYEMIHETRVIPLDGRGHPGKGIQLDMGDARGHWEGSTLVVETTNFRSRTAYRNANADTLRVTERFTRVEPGRVEWSVTIADSQTWTRPWTFVIPLTINDDERINRARR